MSEITSGGVSYDTGELGLDLWTQLDKQGVTPLGYSTEAPDLSALDTPEAPDLQTLLEKQQEAETVSPYSENGPDLQSLISQSLGTGTAPTQSSSFLSDLLKSASSADKDTKNLVGNVVGGLLLSAAGLGKQDREMRQTRELLAQKDEYTQAAEKRAAALLANAKVKKEGWGFNDTGLLSAALQQKASK